LKPSKVIRSESQINYDYATIRITQSRIDKGLIAIPVDLAEWFPVRNDTIEIYLNDSPLSQIKRYSSYNSSTRECRIGGMKEWFQQNSIKQGDEIVIQFVDKERHIYKLIPERNFILKTKELQDSFDNSKSEGEALKNIVTLSKWAQLEKNNVALNEYHRLINMSITSERQYNKRLSRMGESIPANLRILLESIYNGHCQVCDFWFLKRDKKPYFEVHHLDPLKSHHPKNILVVCGNCHNQFEYSQVEQIFDGEWLVRVSFNETTYPVNQAIRKPIEGFFKELFI